MSKSSRTRLTASPKKRVRPSRPKSKTDRLDILDALNKRCERVEMVAGLLEACDDPHSLSPELAAHAGYFIEEELRQVRKLLAEFEGGA
jgi:hypothetical protein